LILITGAGDDRQLPGIEKDRHNGENDL